jgi:hypothetical protein
MKSLKQVSMLAVLAVFATASIAQAHNNGEVCNFIPENNLRIPAGLEMVGGIDEVAFNRVIDKVSAAYGPMITKKGGTLKVNRLWDNATVNASAQRSGKTWVVNMYGGLARHSVTSEDGFTLVMCHEVGHHLGGFPTTGSIFGNNWASNEGQADYFATMKCARAVWVKEDNAKVLSQMEVPAVVKEKCSLQHKSTSEILLCERGAMGGLNLANLLWSLSNGKTSKLALTGLEGIAGKAMPAFDTPNMTQVSKTDSAHPEAQCRLDTYFNGAICGISDSEEFGAKDPITGACSEEKGDKLGFRPRCWYKPSTKF